MSDPHKLTVTAFVLRHHVVGEADKILTLLTREMGLKRCVAKGLRKANSKIGGRLEAFREVTVELAKGRNLDVVTGVDSLRRFPAIATDYDALAAAMAACEVLLAVGIEGEPMPEAYDLFASFLTVLAPPAPAAILLAAFELQVMDLMGYRPELHACTSCGRAIHGPLDAAGLHIEDGGAVCADCIDEAPGRIRRLSGAAWGLLATAQDRPLEELKALQAPEGVVANARLALREYVGYRAERELRAQGMFDWQPAQP